MTSEFIRELVKAHPGIKEVWLIGSRANNETRANSDWDYLVFGDTELLAEIRNGPFANQPNIDLLVVYDSDRFKASSMERPKSGSLSGWEWKKLSPTKAQYRATKLKTDEVNVEVRTSNSRRVWPLPGPSDS